MRLLRISMIPPKLGVIRRCALQKSSDVSRMGHMKPKNWPNEKPVQLAVEA